MTFALTFYELTRHRWYRLCHRHRHRQLFDVRFVKLIDVDFISFPNRRERKRRRIECLVLSRRARIDGERGEHGDGKCTRDQIDNE